MERTMRLIRLAGKVNEYIRGRVSGMITGVTRNMEMKGYATYETDGATILRFDATDEEFKTVCDLVIAHYGQMKEFEIEIVKF